MISISQKYFSASALAALVFLGAGCVSGGTPTTEILQSPEPVFASPEIRTKSDLNTWKEHRGVYRVVPDEPNSKYGTLVKDCNLAFDLDPKVQYLYLGGTVGSVEESQQCYPFLSIIGSGDGGAEMLFSYFTNEQAEQEVTRGVSLYSSPSAEAFLEAIYDEDSRNEVKDFRRFFVDGMPAEQIVYGQKDSIKENDSDANKQTGIQIYTWIHSEPGTVLVGFDGNRAEEDTYQIIVSTIRFK